MTAGKQGGIFGKIAMSAGYITQADINEALAMQQNYEKSGGRVPRLGEILVALNKLSADQVRELLRRQHAMLGEVPEIPVVEHEDAAAPAAGEVPAKNPAERTPTGSRPAVDEEYVEGGSFGNYALVRRIGGGALGSAWRASYGDGKKGDGKKKTVMLRIFSAEAMSSGCDLVQHFDRHIIRATRLDHPHIQKIIRGGVYDGRYYYVCEFAEGQSLRCLLEESGRLSPAKTLELASQIASALQYGHGKEFLHNHISPSSILVSPSFEVKLSAYGMMPDPVGNLRLMAEETGKMPFYAAPELIIADGDLSVAGAWSDFYSLGAVLYHCLVGLPPFNAESLEAALGQMHKVGEMEGMLRDAELDQKLADLVLCLLAPDPQQRVKTAGELLVALAPLVDQYPFRKTNDFKPPRPPKLAGKPGKAEKAPEAPADAAAAEGAAALSVDGSSADAAKDKGTERPVRIGAAETGVSARDKTGGKSKKDKTSVCAPREKTRSDVGSRRESVAGGQAKPKTNSGNSHESTVAGGDPAGRSGRQTQRDKRSERLSGRTERSGSGRLERRVLISICALALLGVIAFCVYQINYIKTHPGQSVLGIWRSLPTVMEEMEAKERAQKEKLAREEAERQRLEKEKQERLAKAAADKAAAELAAAEKKKADEEARAKQAEEAAAAAAEKKKKAEEEAAAKGEAEPAEKETPAAEKAEGEEEGKKKIKVGDDDDEEIDEAEAEKLRKRKLKKGSAMLSDSDRDAAPAGEKPAEEKPAEEKPAEEKPAVNPSMKLPEAGKK